VWLSLSVGSVYIRQEESAFLAPRTRDSLILWKMLIFKIFLFQATRPSTWLSCSDEGVSLEATKGF